MHYVARVLGALALVGTVAAAGFSILLAVADFEFRTGTPEGVERAVTLEPRNTEYLAQRALQVEYGGGDPRPLLERWAALEPYESAPRIRLGLDAEVRGDSATAEKWLLKAAEVDRQYEPRFTLVNYYFRQGKIPEFWKWMREAMEVSYGDRSLAFDLCWQVSNDSAEIWSRAIPERRDVVVNYVTYVIARGHADAITTAALKLASWKRLDDMPELGGAMDALLDAGRAEDARAVWEAVGFAAPRGIVSGEFAAPRFGHGFDWRFATVAGVKHVALDSPPAHRMVMNGQQPEAFELLRQFVMLTPGRRYRLTWESRTNGFPAVTGLKWNIGAQYGAVRASADWTEGETSVTAPAALATLTLGYQRPVGEVRAEGQVELRHVTLTETPQ